MGGKFTFYAIVEWKNCNTLAVFDVVARMHCCCISKLDSKVVPRDCAWQGRLVREERRKIGSNQLTLVHLNLALFDILIGKHDEDGILALLALADDRISLEERQLLESGIVHVRDCDTGKASTMTTQWSV